MARTASGRRHGNQGSILAQERREQFLAFFVGLAAAGAILISFMAIRKSLSLC